MAGEKLNGGSSMTLLLQKERLPCSPEHIQTFWVQNSQPSFQGSKSLVNVVNVRDRPFFRGVEREENDDDEDFEVFPHQPGKKRRLTSEQVQFLESNFEMENKLEPERKVQLAKELGMQPRQVAIWFQNRRARFKTKQLEKDYGMLKARFDILKRDYDNLVQENAKLKEEVYSLKKVIPREKEKQNLDDTSCDAVNSGHKEQKDLIINGGSENESKVALPVMIPLMLWNQTTRISHRMRKTSSAKTCHSYQSLKLNMSAMMNHLKILSRSGSQLKIKPSVFGLVKPSLLLLLLLLLLGES
ncbi:hypothetical protein VIGAN_01228100 [Vigna angularis var. angularis]|uniref:Homeobox-leucine zipper protein n=1 Tax=Vigna angularis var. angularis TaxID=157739 RepID=A0A0S3R1Y6_PHAAN|nr:hypothetical protein VIGAN_01228100 [Vigna angularis var. angularis]